MRLLIIRHGDPDYAKDSLTEKGKLQAQALAKRLAVHGLDRIYASPISGPRVREALADYGGTVIAVSHDRKFLTQVCGSLYRLTGEGLLPVDQDALLGEGED